MARVCLCCRHLKREELDARLLAGDSSTAVAEAYEVSHDSVSRHRHKHLAGPMVAAAEAALAALPDTEEARLERARLALSVAHGSNLLTQLGELVRDASAIQQRARRRRRFRNRSAGCSRIDAPDQIGSAVQGRAGIRQQYAGQRGCRLQCGQQNPIRVAGPADARRGSPHWL